MNERMVYLALSQKAARLLESIIAEAEADVTLPASQQRIIKDIHRDLHDQIEQPKKRSKKRGH